MREPAEIVSGPHRKVSMAFEQKTEAEKELNELRKEVIEARNLVIKTDNLLKNLHADMKKIGARQDEFQRRQFFSSVGAYVLFALFAAGAAFGVSRAGNAGVMQERDRLEHQVGELTGQLDKSKADSSGSQLAQRQAADVYRMMTQLPGDERLKGIDALVKLDTSRLTPLERAALNDRAQLLRKEIGEQAFERGRVAYKKNDLGTAIADLSRFVAMNPEPAEQLEASFYLGSSLNLVKKHADAVPYLEKFVSGDKHAKTREYAMLQLAQSYEQTGQLEKGAELMRDALGTYPNSQYQNQWKARLSSIKRLQGAGADSPAMQQAVQTAAAAAAPGAPKSVAMPAVVAPKPAPLAKPLVAPPAKP